jgi:3-oxosteroid 1-dehydrogenase
VTPADVTVGLPDRVDMIVLGSGAGGLTAALTGALNGLSCLVLESQPQIGGTSARSSGTVWIPDNMYMRAAGLVDDREKAERYLEALISGRGPKEMWLRFLDQGPAMLEDLNRQAGVRFRPFPTAPDYRQDIPGAAPGWRPLEPEAFDGKELGDWFERLAWPLPELMLFGGMMITRSEGAQLLKADRSLKAALLGARLIARFAAERVSYARGTRLVLGNALVARLLKECLTRGVDVVSQATVSRLIVDGGSIAGVAIQGVDGSEKSVKCDSVVLAGGGFPASEEWREAELPQPTPEYTPAAPGCVGSTLAMAMAAGASLGQSGMDNGLWFPSSVAKRADGSTAVYPHIVLDRAKPGTIAVDSSGRRFVNEGVSYHEFVRGMYRANQETTAIPAWMICGRDFIRKYGLGIIRPRTPSVRKYVESGYLTEAATIPTLAEKIGVPADRLVETVERFNGFAAAGKDEDFHRGETIYDRGNGDAGHGPNPSLGPLDKGPFYAVALYPTPLGTSRGLRADVEARVLTADGTPIPGLYVCGNDMQSAFGGEYPGAGGQLGQAMTFGWIAARHAARYSTTV